MDEILVWSMVAGNVLVAIYLAITPRMHAQPWRLFVLGVFSLVLVFWFQDSTEVIVRLVGESKVGRLKSGANLVVMAVSAMVGAIFGTAITNRVHFLNKREIEALMQRMSSAEKLYLKSAEDIYAKLTDQSQTIPQQEFLQLDAQRKKLLFKYHDAMIDLQDELQKLSP